MLRSFKSRMSLLVVAVAVGASALGVASPASATTISGTFDCTTHPGATINAAAGDTLNFTSLSNCGNIAVTASQFASAAATNGGGVVTPSTSLGTTYWQAFGINTLSLTLSNSVTGTVTIQGSASASTPPSSVVVVQIGGGGGGSSSSSVASPLQTLSLSVAASGATCSGGNPTGYAGSWLTLPGADKCSQSGPTAKAGAKLLGWATNASFPVDRAQAQIDKHWGVIDEVINGTRMIFIPGGMATFVSGSNNLYPIWSA